MSDFFIALQKFVNEKDIIPLYYEEASKNASFPYGVIKDPKETDLRFGKLVYYDIYICTADDFIGEKLEEKVQELINILDRKIFSEERAVTYFESQNPVQDVEFELIKKQVTFSVRIF